MSLSQARTLRRRASHLRQLAGAIEASPVMRLDRSADVDTWRGPRPQLCRDLLANNQARLFAAADDLRRRAYLFEQRAIELEASAALLPDRAG